MTSPERPRARLLAPTPIKVGGQQYVVVDDPEGVVPEGCAISVPLYLVLSMCDGQRTLEDIQASVVAELGRFVSLADVTDAVRDLDRHGLLEGEYASRRIEELTRAYRSAPRPAAHAGSIYPDDAAALRRFLDSLLAKAAPSLPAGVEVACIVAPHIDYQRGGEVYAEAYAAARDHVRAETFIVLGVAHSPCENPAILTRQSYDTPLGPLRTDEEVVMAVEDALGSDAYRGELLHREEHSIELQAVWIRHLFPEARMVGILCSHLSEAREGSLEAADALAEGLRRIMHRSPGRYCLIAGVDLTHVGPDFGHARAVDSRDIDRASEIDRRVMTALLAGSAEGVLHACEPPDGDEDPNVCGQAPLYIAARTMSPCMGSVLRYGHAPTPSGTSLVGFCAAAIWRRPED